MVANPSARDCVLGTSLSLPAQRGPETSGRVAVLELVAANDVDGRGLRARAHARHGCSDRRGAAAAAGPAHPAHAGHRATGPDPRARSISVDARARYRAVPLRARDEGDSEFHRAQAGGDRPHRARRLCERIVDSLVPDERRRNRFVLSRLDQPRSTDAARHRYRRGIEECARSGAQGRPPDPQAVSPRLRRGRLRWRARETGAESSRGRLPGELHRDRIGHAGANPHYRAGRPGDLPAR